MGLVFLVIDSLKIVDFGSIMQEGDVVENVIIEWDFTHLLDDDWKVL